MNNKEVIDALQEYFLKQDPKDIARFLANMMIDLNRFLSIEELPPDEAESLYFRIRYNVQQLRDFAKNGSVQGLTLTNIEPKE